MIRYGDTKSIPELKRLWNICFDDEDIYINDFFAALYEDQNVLLAEENGVLMGASFFLPGKIFVEEGEGYWQEIRYVYALAVDPKFRRRGIAGELLHRAYELYQTPLIAEPANEGLVGGFYEPLGFAKAFYLKRVQIEMPDYGVQAAEISAAESRAAGCLEQTDGAAGTDRNSRIYQQRGQSLEQMDDASGCDRHVDKGQQCERHQEEQIRVCDAGAEDYTRIRDSFFLKNGYIRWPVRHIAFAIQEHCKNGGEALICTQGTRDDILLYFVEDERVIVTETTLGAEKAGEVLRERIPCAGRMVYMWRQCHGQNPAKGLAEQSRLMGVVYGSIPEGGYLNLSLD